MSVSKSKRFGMCLCGYSKGFSGKGMELCLGHKQPCLSMWGMPGKWGEWWSSHLFFCLLIFLIILNVIVFEKVSKYQ